MVMVVVWIASALYSFPRFIWVGTVTTNLSNGMTETICITQRRRYDSKLFDMINFSVLYVAPLAVMMVLYSLIAVTLWHSSWGLERHYLTNGTSPPFNQKWVSGTASRKVQLFPVLTYTFTGPSCHPTCESRQAPGDAGENLVAFCSIKSATGIARNYVTITMEKNCTNDEQNY
jgi:hypothetical protein